MSPGKDVFSASLPKRKNKNGDAEDSILTKGEIDEQIWDAEDSVLTKSLNHQLSSN